MTVRRAFLATLVVVFVAGLMAGLAASCGSTSTDKFAGTWVAKSAANVGIKIVKKDATHYVVSGPDGSNPIDTTVQGDTLVGKTPAGSGPGARPTPITLTFKDDGMTFTLGSGTRVTSIEMVRK